MNLENFPTSEAAQRMLQSVDTGGFYEKSYVGKWIFQVMGLEMDEVRMLIEALPDQAFPETATWGLDYHEQKYGLPVRKELSYDERRRLIYQKRDIRSPMNPYRMEQILENMTGRKAHVNDEDTPVNTFTVELEPGENTVDVLAAINKLKSIKQSHVSFILWFTALARIEICGHIDRYTARYTSCGTTPVISTGLCVTAGNVEIAPATEKYAYASPTAGEIKTGEYPKTSSGMKLQKAEIEAIASLKRTRAVYQSASDEMKAGTYPKDEAAVFFRQTHIEAESKTESMKFWSKSAGTVPGISTGLEETENSVMPKIRTESYHIRYKCCGDEFEI